MLGYSNNYFIINCYTMYELSVLLIYLCSRLERTLNENSSYFILDYVAFLDQHYCRSNRICTPSSQTFTMEPFLSFSDRLRKKVMHKHSMNTIITVNLHRNSKLTPTENNMRQTPVSDPMVALHSNQTTSHNSDVTTKGMGQTFILSSRQMLDDCSTVQK